MKTPFKQLSLSKLQTYSNSQFFSRSLKQTFKTQIYETRGQDWKGRIVIS